MFPPPFPESLPESAAGSHNSGMEQSPFRLTVATLLVLIACVAVNFWLFRLGVLWGILGLNVSKHFAVAYLCEVLSGNRHRAEAPQKARQPTPRLPV